MFHELIWPDYLEVKLQRACLLALSCTEFSGTSSQETIHRSFAPMSWSPGELHQRSSSHLVGGLWPLRLKLSRCTVKEESYSLQNTARPTELGILLSFPALQPVDHAMQVCASQTHTNQLQL